MDRIPGELIPIVICIGAYAMVLGIRYLKTKERMAMIERGMDPTTLKSAPRPNTPMPFIGLKIGLLFIGVGIGLLLSLAVTQANNIDEAPATAVFFGFIGIMGGLGLIVSYIIEMKHINKAQLKKEAEEARRQDTPSL